MRFVEKQVGGKEEVVNSSSTSSSFVDSYRNQDSSCADESFPVAINRKNNCSGDSIGEMPELEYIHSTCGSMSRWRSQTITTTTRPTQDEESSLWEMISTPPAKYALPRNDSNDSERAYTRDFDKDSLPVVVSLNELPSCGSPLSHTVTYTIPKFNSGPPYESYLAKSISESPPIQPFQIMIDAGKRTALRARSGVDTMTQKIQSTPSNKCNHFGMGPYLGSLPESIIYYTISFIEYSERHPTMQLISHGMTSVLTKPELFLEMKRAYMGKDRSETSLRKSLRSQVLCDDEFTSPTPLNEILFVVGGKYPTKRGNSDEEMYMRSEDGCRIHRRMTMQSNKEMGIIGYDPRKKTWIRFGGDPMQPFSSNSVSNEDVSTSSTIHLCRKEALHPLSPFGIVNAQPLYLGHPHYSLLFFGGTYQDTDLPSSRVIGYSFLTAKWELWPEMMRPRHGDDFILARVGFRDEETDVMEEKLPYRCGDSVVLIGCDLEFCDCFRCNNSLSSQTSGEKDRDETISLDVNCFPSEEKSRNTRADLDSIGRCEILDLATRTWKTRESRPPSSPPDDGGVAVLGGRYVFLPGTCPPPPPSSSCADTTFRWNQSRENLDESTGITEAVTPLSQSEINSEDGIDASKSSMHDTNESEEDIPTSMDMDHDMSLHEDIESNNDDDITNDFAAVHTPFHTLHYRPGLVYDSWRDTWSTLPPRPYVTTSSPTTCTYKNRVLVMGGYRSSSENALSCYRHREDDCILDYEDHLDYVWWFSPGDYDDDNDGSSIRGGKWTFGGGTTSCGHSQSWASSGDISAAVEAAAALQKEQQLQIMEMQQSHTDGTHKGVGGDCGIVGCVDKGTGSGDLPCHAPASVRGASTTIYRGRLTMLGGLSTFSRTFYDEERRSIWQYFSERREWRKMEITLPVPALLDGYAFSLYV